VAADRVRVICSLCGWAGRRLAAGGPCPECDGTTVEPPTRAPRAAQGRRVRVVAHVLPATAEVLEAERERTSAVGLGTVAGQWLDARAAKRR
jgi:hypothetical protein